MYVASHDALVETSQNVRYQLASVTSIAVLVDTDISALNGTVLHSYCLPYCPETVNARAIFEEVALKYLVAYSVGVAGVLAYGVGIDFALREIEVGVWSLVVVTDVDVEAALH